MQPAPSSIEDALMSSCQRKASLSRARDCLRWRLFQDCDWLDWNGSMSYALIAAHRAALRFFQEMMG
jgi:hypothetical protein